VKKKKSFCPERGPGRRRQEERKQHWTSELWGRGGMGKQGKKSSSTVIKKGWRRKEGR